MEPLRATSSGPPASSSTLPTDAADEMFPGEALCRHNSSVRSWKEMSGDDYVVIGGYESGMDAAFNLAACGKKCTVAASTRCWTTTTDDPSTELAPYTVQRINEALEMPTPPRLLAPLRVTKVEEAKGGDKGFLVHATWGEAEDDEGSFVSKRRVTEEEKGEDEPGEEGTEIVLRTPQPPILCTGFEGSVSLGVASALFEYGNDQACNAHAPVLTDTDQSTITPGLFLVGSLVQHGELSFCFVYSSAALRRRRQRHRAGAGVRHARLRAGGTPDRHVHGRLHQLPGGVRGDVLSGLVVNVLKCTFVATRAVLARLLPEHTDTLNIM